MGSKHDGRHSEAVLAPRWRKTPVAGFRGIHRTPSHFRMSAAHPLAALRR